MAAAPGGPQTLQHRLQPHQLLHSPIIQAEGGEQFPGGLDAPPCLVAPAAYRLSDREPALAGEANDRRAHDATRTWLPSPSFHTSIRQLNCSFNSCTWLMQNT